MPFVVETPRQGDSSDNNDDNQENVNQGVPNDPVTPFTMRRGDESDTGDTGAGMRKEGRLPGVGEGVSKTKEEAEPSGEVPRTDKDYEASFLEEFSEDFEEKIATLDEKERAEFEKTQAIDHIIRDVITRPSQFGT